ncbi:hypothetical protein NC652_034010 [Populus alba x Populus x berolinensis]|nr:hypothetical protein NC652_034010 [Populus alba x Populus x berolinensis]
MRSSFPNDHDRSTVLVVHAPSAVPPCSSSSVSQPTPPPPECALCPAILPPIPKVAPIPNTLETVIVEDYSSDEGLDETLLKEEQLDFSFTDDDGEDLLTFTPLISPLAGLVPPSTSEGCSPSIVDIGGGASPTKTVAGTSLASTPGSKVWKDLFYASKSSAQCTKLKNFSLNQLTKSCDISLEDFQPQFEGPSTNPVETVIQDNKLAPCVTFKDWITVEPRQKSNKHICGNTKGKEVIAAEVRSDVNPCTKISPSIIDEVVGSIGAWASLGAEVDSRNITCLVTPNLGDGSPNEESPLEELVTQNMKHHNLPPIDDSNK